MRLYHRTTYYCRLCRLRYWERGLPFILFQPTRISPQVHFFSDFYQLTISSHTEERPNGSSLSSDLVAAIHSRKTTSDITHVLSLAPNGTDQIVDTLYATLSAFFEKASFKSMSSLWTWEVLGVAVETYRYVVRLHPRLRMSQL